MVQVPTQEQYDKDLKEIRDRLVLLENATPPDPDPDPVPTPVPGFWLSGGNPNNNLEAPAKSFGAWRGRPVSVALTYPTRTFGWGPLTSISGQPAAWTDKSIPLVIQVSPFPVGMNCSYAALNRGEYDEQWKTFARNWKARADKGFAHPFFSLAWEANHNGNMHAWCGPSTAAPEKWRTTTEYKDGFKRIISIVRDIYKEIIPCWIPNGHDSPGMPGNDPTNIYPGDDFVDVIGVDYYDHYPPSYGGNMGQGKKDFLVEANEVNGVLWYMEMAIAHKKKFAVPEWAVSSNSTTTSGGDNPEFVKNMYEKVFKVAHSKGIMAFECYYDDVAQKMDIQFGQNPKAAVMYQSLYRVP